MHPDFGRYKIVVHFYIALKYCERIKLIIKKGKF